MKGYDCVKIDWIARASLPAEPRMGTRTEITPYAPDARRAMNRLLPESEKHVSRKMRRVVSAPNQHRQRKTKSNDERMPHYAAGSQNMGTAGKS